MQYAVRSEALAAWDEVEWWYEILPLSNLQRAWKSPILDRISASLLENTTCPASQAKKKEKEIKRIVIQIDKVKECTLA
jgi:hypothetical protein